MSCLFCLFAQCGPCHLTPCTLYRSKRKPCHLPRKPARRLNRGDWRSECHVWTRTHLHLSAPRLRVLVFPRRVAPETRHASREHRQSPSALQYPPCHESSIRRIAWHHRLLTDNMEQLKRRGMTGGGSASPPSSPPSSSQPRTSSSSSSSSNATYGKAKLERHLQRKALRQIKESESAGGSSRDSDIGNDSTTAAASSRKKHPHLTASSILTHANRVQKDKDTDRDLFARKTLTRALSSESAFAARDASGSSTGPSSSAPEAVLTGEKRKRGVVALTLPTRDRGDAGTRASPIVTDVDRSVLSGEIAPLTGKGSKGESSAAAGQPKKPADPVPTKAKSKFYSVR